VKEREGEKRTKRLEHIKELKRDYAKEKRAMTGGDGSYSDCSPHKGVKKKK